ncbi:MAG: hypothetical protein Q7J73_00635 [Dehalococcoidales bacterium]|nr:hypothetical protein [Dehalococcoidales bacterium]
MKRIALILMLIIATPALAYQPSLAVCAPGDTCVYYAEQPRPGGMLTLPDSIGVSPIVILWSETAQPRADVQTDVPIPMNVADGDSTIEVPSGAYFVTPILCAVVSLLLVDGVETARLIWMNGLTQEYPLSKVRLYAVGRAQ